MLSHLLPSTKALVAPFLLRANNASGILAISKASVTSFFGERSADVLWKTNTSVSSIGRKRGRAKGLARIKNLHRGQQIGLGSARIAWPGLKTRGYEDDRKSTDDFGKVSESSFKKYEEDLEYIRKVGTGVKRRGLKLSPLQRGWTSATPKGRRYGPPRATNTDEDPFAGFDSILVQYQIIHSMHGSFGRQRRPNILMVTGNGKGIAGFTLSTSAIPKPAAFQKAVDRAGLRLCKFNLYENRTVYHDFFTQFGNTKLYVQQRPPGFGLSCHRVITAVCKLIGIKDLHVVVEGARKNYLHMVKAFFLGLLRQRTHQRLADEKGLHLVEMRAENDFFPRVVASPSGHVRTEDEILPNEILDFETICYEGHLPHLESRKNVHSNEGTEGWETYIKRGLSRRHHYEQRIQMRADYGRVMSHLEPDFPECVPAVYDAKALKAAKMKSQEMEDDYD